jgi:hypothetical protein
MSTTEATTSNYPPSPSRECRENNGRRACFYPGFVRRLAVVSPDGSETLLYEQDKPFILPPGQVKPWPSSTLEYTDDQGRGVMVHIDDPHQQIHRIEVRLKSSGMKSVGANGSGDTLVCDNEAILCPPICPQ